MRASSAPCLYGRHAVGALLQADPGRIAELLLCNDASPRLQGLAELAGRAAVPVQRASRAALTAAAGEGAHQGIVARLRRPFAYAPLATLLAAAAERGPRGLLVVLDQVQDPHNVGAIARSALALGAQGLVLTQDRACEVTPAVARAAAGATAHLAVARVVNLRRALGQMQGAGLWLVGTVPGGAPAPAHLDLRRPLALVVGAEGTGLRASTQAACDYLAAIPMVATAGSLNASVAAAIALYEVARQRDVPAGA